MVWKTSPIVLWAWVLTPIFSSACAGTAPIRPDVVEPVRLEGPVMTGRDTAAAYERFLRAELERSGGNACEAAKQYRHALDMSFAPPQLLVRFAGALVDCDRAGTAARVLERVAPEDRVTGAYWLVSARIFASQGRSQDRLAALRRAVTLEKDDIEPLLALADAVEDPTQKRELLTLAVARQPASDRAHLKLALLHLQQKRPFAARRHLDAYVKLRPDEKETIERRFGHSP